MNTVPPDPAKSTVEGGIVIVSPSALVGVVPDLPGYEIQELVGRGGMGKVYRARHLELNRTVAIKVLAHEPDEKLLARFRDEARAVAKLQHSNIAQLYDTGTFDGRPFFAQEFVDGGTLAQKFAGQPQDPAFAARTVETIARAIQHSHAHGILHRDLKPGNVLLASDGTPKVTDFGLAKELTPTPADGSTITHEGGLTRTGEILGTPGYMPPEQASGVTSNLGPTADVYSLGAILYEALTGRPPFQAPDALQTLLMVLSMDPVPPRTLLPKLPRDLDTICLKCLEKSPRKRYATAGELADDLKRFLSGEPIVARPVPVTERMTKWARRKKAQAALVGVSALFAVAVIAAAVWLFVTNSQLTKLNSDLAAAKSDLEKSNAELLVAKQESDKSYTLAMSAVDGIVRDVSLKLNGIPQAEALLLDVVARSSELYRQLSEVRPSDGEAVTRHLSALSMQSSYETNYGRHEAAARTRRELADTLRRELGKAPDSLDLHAWQLRLTFDSAMAARAEKKMAESAAARAEYIRTADRYAEQFSGHASVAQYQVRKHWLRGFDAADRKDPEGRIAALKDAVATARSIADPASRFTFLSSSISQLGMVLSIANRMPEADAAYAEAQEVYEKAPDQIRNSGEVRSGLATIQVKRAVIAMDDRRYQDAEKLYAAAEPVLRALVQDFPLNRNYHQSLAECLFSQGVLCMATEPVRCRKLMDEAIAVMDALLKRRPEQGDQATRDRYAKTRDSLPKPDEDK